MKEENFPGRACGDLMHYERTSVPAATTRPGVPKIAAAYA